MVDGQVLPGLSLGGAKFAKLLRGQSVNCNTTDSGRPSRHGPDLGYSCTSGCERHREGVIQQHGAKQVFLAAGGEGDHFDPG